MRNTRKAAAVWLAMSLAISTAFGNTAWGEIRPDTGNNRCVHVHTAECYKDADETATPSQIGKEPTECTHICSVESGCIRDTEKENNENADTLDAVASNTGKNDSKKEQAGEKAADRKDSSGNTDENKNLNDVPAQNGAALSASTPSNAKDTTTTGGTITPVSQMKILSWSWFDPEENLLDGRLELTGITEEAQPSFTEIIEYLPTAIIARVEEGEEKNLPITNWSCPEYVQDEEGRWPLEGTYEFKAELPEEYELAEGVDALVVEVSVVGDQAAVTANEWPVLRVSPASGKESKTLNFDGKSFSSLNGVFDSIRNQTNIQVDYLGKGTDDQHHFRLTLNNTSASNIIIPSGDWEIVLNGNNKLDGAGKQCAGIALHITDGGTATIVAGTGAASLTANGYKTSGNADGSCGIEVQGNLTVKSGNVVAVMEATGQFNDASGAIYVTQKGTLNINGGSVTAKGKGKYGLCALGTVNMSEGNFEITGENKVAVDHGQNSNFTLSGGTVTITSLTGHTGFITKGNLTIKGGRMNVNILEIAKGVTTTVEGGTLETGGLVIGDNGKLINNGTLIANGSFEGNGTIENTGTISGTGSVPDSAKQPPEKITGYSANIGETYSENMSIDVPQCAQITKPAKAGELQYELVEYTGSESKGEGTIDRSKGLLTVNKAGVFKIKVKTLASGIYQEGTPVEITLTVDKADFPNTWTVNVDAVSGVYNGTEGYPAATITSTRIPKDAEYKYQLAATSKSSNLPDQWQSECPKIVNVNESGQYVFVKVITDNYKSKVFRSNNTTHITQRSFTESVEVAIDSSVYNNKPQNPKIKVLENWKGTLGSELTEGIDYEISFWKKENNNQSVTKLEDAGTYIVYLLGKGNYDGSLKTAAFTINKCKLKAQITGDSYDKVYDGTTDIAEEQRLAIQLCDDNNNDTPALQDVHADQVKWAYQSADVGEHDIDATIISLAGDQAKNYELTEQTISQKGTIKPRDFASMTVSADPLTYNGTEQQPKINASVETGLENVSPDAVFTYSKDGVDYQSEIPGFTDAGTYQVYVKASMDNFNDAVKTVNVTVQQAPSSSGSHSGGGGKGSSGKSSSGSSGTVTKDSQKGYRSEEQGVITGASNQAVNDGYSHWIKDARGWWLRYSDGTWPMGNTGAFHWEKVNGRWWAFGAEGYLSTGWIYDTLYQGWFYMDENQGMLTGWQFINGKWYYLNSNQDGSAGIMYSKRRTPDGWYVKEDGSWDEEAGR